MRQSEVFESKFLKHEDLLIAGTDDYRSAVVTLTGDVEWSTPFQDGGRQRMVKFKEIDKPLGLNKTNWNSIAKIAKESDDEKWGGVKVELWVDENIPYEGKLVSGIRIRKPAFSATLAPEAKTLPPIEAAPQIPAIETTSSGIVSKKGAWLSWQQQAQPEKPDAGEFKGTIATIATRRAKTEAQFGPAEWNELANSYIPF